MNGVCAMNPGWEMRLWTERDAPYPKGNAVEVSNWLRFWALLEFGGIYLDTDMEALGPLEGLELKAGKMNCDQTGIWPHHAFLGCEKGNATAGRLETILREDARWGRRRVLQDWARHRTDWNMMEIGGVLRHHFLNTGYPK